MALRAAGDNSPIHENAHKNGYFNHFHTFYHGKAHAFYGYPQFIY